MTEDRSAGATSMVFQPDPARFRRARRAELFGGAILPAVLIAGLLALPTPFWLFGVGLFAVVGYVFARAARVRWNAIAPSITFDPSGITYRERDLGVIKDRSPDERQLAWSEIESVELSARRTSQSDFTFVRIHPLRPDAGPDIHFQPPGVGASEADLAEAFARFAPQRLHTIVDKRSPAGAGGRWGAAIGALLIVALLGGLTWAWGSGAVDGYRATHRGVPGTLVVTGLQRGHGEDAGSVSVSGDFTPSSGGPVRHGVSFASKSAIVGFSYRVYASGPNAATVYPMDSRQWVVDTVGASLVGVFLLAVLIALAVWGIRTRLRRSIATG